MKLLRATDRQRLAPILLLMLGCLFTVDISAATLILSKKIEFSQAGPPNCQSRVVPLTNSTTNIVCAVYGVAGAFEGEGEWGRVGMEGGKWMFRGNSCQKSAAFWVLCFK